MANEKIIFDQEKSRTAQSLSGLNDREMFERYFLVGNKSDWNADVNVVLNTLKDKDYIYPLLVSLEGTLLNTLTTLFDMRLKPYIPEGYKMNAQQIISDIERIFRENPNEIRKSAFARHYTDFARDAILYVLDNCNKGLDYKISVTVN